MREIIFRGQRADSGEWVYGFLTKMWGAYHIVDKNNENSAYEVIPETVGQYTGLVDKNGKMIFEGDIVQSKYTFYNEGKYEVCFSKKRRGWFPFACGDGCGRCKHEVEDPEYIEIIGNKWDNEELLEKK